MVGQVGLVTDVSRASLGIDSLIRDAIEVIDRGGLQIALVTDDSGCLVGIVTDGDVRRGLLRGETLDSPAERIINTEFKALPVGSEEALALQLMRSESIHHVPIIDGDRIVGLFRIDDVQWIPYGHQSISEDDVAAVAEVLRGDWLTTGPTVRAFEEAVTQIVGSAGCVAVTSGTAALHCAYFAAGIGPGDEVITPPITFVATQAAAVNLGARVVFADVDPTTALIDPEKVRQAVTERTKAIVAVDYAGQPAPLDELRAIADECGAILIEDAAHSLGAQYRGRPVGSCADITTFSFFPTKNITTGEGGAVVSTSADLLERSRRFHNHGLIRNREMQDWPDEGPWHQEVGDFGLNYRMSDLSAGLGLSQLSRLEEFRLSRQRVVEAYGAAFAALPECETLRVSPWTQPFWHLYPFLVPASERKRIFVELRRRNIGVQVNYLPAHLHPVFRRQGFNWGDFPASEEFYRREISLPLYANMPEGFLVDVIEAVLASV